MTAADKIKRDAEKRKRLITVMLQAGGYKHADIVKATGYSLMTVKRVSRAMADKPPKRDYGGIPGEKRLITVMLQAGGYRHADIVKATGYSLGTVKAVSMAEGKKKQ